MNIAEFSVRQSVLVNVLFFVCLLGGYAALQLTPVEFFPEVNLNKVSITTVWSGASAEEVERLVTLKLEEELYQVTDIDEMRSQSQADTSTIVIEFDEFLDDVGYESALNDVRAAIDRAQDLPDDAEDPYIFEVITTEAFPAVVVAVIDTEGIAETALREIGQDVRSRLERLPGVSKAAVRGYLEREIRVLVDRDAAARYGLAVPAIAERIRRKNLNLPAGTFGDQDGEATLRAQGDYQSLEEILETVVRDDEDGSLVRLGEVARVEEGLEKRRFINRFNGMPAEMISVTKRSDADVIKLVTSVDAWIAANQDKLPTGIEVQKTLDTAAFVESRMGILKDNLITGVILVIAILWFTIGFRNAMLTSIAIPFSFLTAIIFFPYLNITINSTTLIGMLLVSGMLVDDAIIVLENVYRRVEAGEPLREAVVEGTREVLWPVVAAVATTCAAFAPLLLIGGTSGKFVSILPKAVIICLLASLLECLLILPAHYLHLGSRKRERKESSALSDSDVPDFFVRLRALPGTMRGGVESGLAALRARYARSLDVVLAYPGSFSVLVVSVLVAGAGYAQHLNVNLFPGEFSTFNVMLESPPGYSLEQTDRLAREIEEQIDSFRGELIRDHSTTVGVSVDTNYDRLTGTNLSMSYLEIPRELERGDQPMQILDAVKQRVDAWAAENPTGIVDLRVAAEQDGPPVGPPVEVRIQSDDYAVSKAIATEMIAFLKTIPGVINVEDNLKLGPSEVRLRVDEERAARHRLRFEDIATALRAANDGIVTSSYRDSRRGEDVDIRVMLAKNQRRGLQDLLEVELATPGGGLIKLGDVATIETTRGFRAYRHYDRKRTVSVSANILDGVATSLGVNQQLKVHFADVEQRYPAVEVRYGGEYQETGEAFAALAGAFPVAFLAIYMILAALFRSYLQPLVVICAIPLGFLGIVLGVGLLGYEISFVLLYATIGLTGVVVNDSLVMVDFINRARASGVPLLEAVKQSGFTRFRPILLTTLTTVMALLPMALGLQGESRSYGPFAAAISFGLIVAMAGTLYVVPLVYVSLASGQSRGRAIWESRNEWIRRLRPTRNILEAPASKLDRLPEDSPR